jgi:hypothetical protein
MKIKLSEQKLNIFLSKMLNEAVQPTFGNGSNSINYKPYIDSISKIKNLHNDRYKDYELDEAWNDWKNIGYDKNSQEYYIYVSKFKNFMFGTGGFLRNLSYVGDRLNGPLHSLLLDPKWVSSLNGKPNWKYSNLNSGEGGDEFHCFYTTVLKLFQNPAIWNDFFFNPMFSQYKEKYDNIRSKITSAMKTNKEQYIQLLPMEEYKQLNFFMNEINQDTKKIEKGLNCKPELFYSENNIEDDGEDDF